MTTDQIKAAVSIEAVVTHYRGTIDAQGRGQCLLAHNHANGDEHPSMTAKDGRVHCWSQGCFGERGADVFSLVGVMDGLNSFKDQKARVCEIGGINGRNGTPATVKKTPRVRTTPPEGELGKTLFVYVDADGIPHIYIQRINRHDGGKHFCPWGPSADGQGWQDNMDNAPKPRPLYRLPAIISSCDDLIVFHEGEKAVEAAKKAGLPGTHTTTIGGSKNAKHTDFSPLAGRDVVICPDNDEAGEAYANDIAALATEAGAASVKILRLPELPSKGDVVDWLANGGTAEQFQQLLGDAPMWEDEPTLVTAMIEYRDLLTLKLPDRQRHLPWLTEGSNTLVFGPRGVGKTWFELGLAVAFVTGDPFLKWPVTAPVGVLYVDGEMALDELRSRTTTLMSKTPKSKLHFLTSELVYHKLQRDLVLTSEDMRSEVTSILDAHPSIRVMILDNISCLFAGLNEDKKQDWEPINAWLIRLRHRGLAVVLVHHAGKGGMQRGTSGREDSLDVVIQLDRPAGYEQTEGCHFEMRFTKSRSVKGDDVTPLDVKLTDLDGVLGWTYSTLEESKVDQVRTLLAEGVTKTGEIAEELGISKGYASRLKKKAGGDAEVS